jgi:murein L,D-transpeptidase YafK
VVVKYFGLSGRAGKQANLAAAASLLALAACNDDGYLPRNSRHWVALSPEIQSKMSEAGVSRASPMLIRAYKKEGELEVWKADSQGEYKLVHTYPICRWSGQLGPKKIEGDRQVPEGFYAITPQMMNPNSSFYLSFNIGYPNQFDRSFGRTGSHIMVHGSCSSRGCFAMTDKQIADIYAMARESFAGGQQAIQMQSLPFRFTPQNLARYRADENMPFWRNLKEGADHFEVTKREPKVAACSRRYVFNASADGVMDPQASCPALKRDEALVAAVEKKNREDEQQVAALTSSVKPIKRIYADGDQHPSFKHTLFAYNAAEGVTRASSVPQTASRIADVSRPDELAAGAVEVPAEQARGLSRQQLIAKHEQVRQQQIAAANPPAPVAAPPVAATPQPVAATTPRSTASIRPPQSGPTPSASAIAAAPAPKDQPAFYQRWLGSLGGALTASANDAEEAPKPTQAPVPPRR